MSSIFDSVKMIVITTECLKAYREHNYNCEQFFFVKKFILFHWVDSTTIQWRWHTPLLTAFRYAKDSNLPWQKLSNESYFYKFSEIVWQKMIVKYDFKICEKKMVVDDCVSLCSWDQNWQPSQSRSRGVNLVDLRLSASRCDSHIKNFCLYLARIVLYMLHVSLLTRKWSKDSQWLAFPIKYMFILAVYFSTE